MVAELADISSSSVERASSSSSRNEFRASTWKRKKRAKWIRTATKDPIYSVLDDEGPVSFPIVGYQGPRNVVVISAVRNHHRMRVEKTQEEKEIKFSKQEVESFFEDEEDEHALYSVVKKPKKDEKDKRLLREMGSERRRWNSISTSSPRGVVGLVGPYRVYPEPNENLEENEEYVLREEELVEEIIDTESLEERQRESETSSSINIDVDDCQKEGNIEKIKKDEDIEKNNEGKEESGKLAMKLIKRSTKKETNKKEKEKIFFNKKILK